MNKIAKTLSATVMAGVMALSLAVSASAACTHYNQRLTCGAYVGTNSTNHVYYTVEYGVSIPKNCTQSVIGRKHTRTCIVNGGCGYSFTDGGSGCYMTHSACGKSTEHFH